MFTPPCVGDRVLNSTTGRDGKVLGYGHQIQNNTYVPTLRVWNSSRRVEEDFTTNWVKIEVPQRELQYSK